MNSHVLGKGREGTVYDQGHGVCVKLFHRGTSIEQRQRSWARQCQFLLLNRDTNLVPRMYAASATGEVPYIIMERIDGMPSKDTELARQACKRLQPSGGTWSDLLSRGNWAIREDREVVFYEGGSLV